MGFFRRLLDRYYSFRDWCHERRDTIARLQGQIYEERDRHRRQSDDMADRIAMLERKIEFLVQANRENLSYIESMIAVHGRNRARAENESEQR